MQSINIKNLTFKYDEATVIDSLSLNIDRKSFISIIGPNGSGKSTLLKLIATNLIPNDGVVLLNDKDVKAYKSKDLAMEMAVVPQDTAVSYDFTVEDIVMMGRHPHLKRFQKEDDKDFKIAKEAMEATNTWHLKDRKINEISGGERQRVIIAKAIAQKPRIILLDEPTSSLDIHHQIELLELLKQLNSKMSVTIIAVLHDINLAARFSKEIILLHKGKLVTMGKTEDVLTVANLQQAYEMNMIIEKNVYTGSIQIHPISINKRNNIIKDKKIHVVCGGGTGRELIQELIDKGYRVSIGVVNEGDSDWQMGKLFNLEMAVELPFNNITDASLCIGNQLADIADIIILTDVPIGWGNIRNLEIIKKQLMKGKSVFRKKHLEGISYDYTDGRGKDEIDGFQRKGIIEISHYEEMYWELEETK